MKNEIPTQRLLTGKGEGRKYQFTPTNKRLNPRQCQIVLELVARTSTEYRRQGLEDLLRRADELKEIYQILEEQWQHKVKGTRKKYKPLRKTAAIKVETGPQDS